MATFTKRQEELIRDNLRAFRHNFGAVRIEKQDGGPGYYVFFPADSESYIQFCYNIDYLNGWLYGAVQGFLRSEFRRAADSEDVKKLRENM